MNNDTDQLAALAAAASDGPWTLRESSVGDDCFVQAPGNPDMPYRLDVCGDDYTGHGDEEQRRANFEFIAAVNPATIRALLKRLNQYEADARRYQYVKGALTGSLGFGDGWLMADDVDQWDELIDECTGAGR